MRIHMRWMYMQRKAHSTYFNAFAFCFSSTVPCSWSSIFYKCRAACCSRYAFHNHTYIEKERLAHKHAYTLSSAYIYIDMYTHISINSTSVGIKKKQTYSRIKINRTVSQPESRADSFLLSMLNLYSIYVKM